MLRSTLSTALGAVVVLLLLAAGPAESAGDMTFKASDGATVHAALSESSQPGQAIALLFHQAHGNRHEYDAIAPRLNRLGFDTLAVDQRSGGHMFDHANRTVEARGSSGSYDGAYADLEGALTWARDHNYPSVVAVGSSYSASLVLQLAAEHGDALTAVAAFSPGEYFDTPDRIKNAVARIDVPVYITTDPKEEGHVDEVLTKVGNAENITRYKPENGIHGASTLDADRDPAGAAANWQSFSKFMARFAPGDSS